MTRERPREFWIERKSFSSNCLTTWDEKPDEITYRVAKDIIHVIEYSAYQALERKLEIAKAALEEIAEPVGYLDEVCGIAQAALAEIEGEG